MLDLNGVQKSSDNSAPTVRPRNITGEPTSKICLRVNHTAATWRSIEALLIPHTHEHIHTHIHTHAGCCDENRRCGCEVSSSPHWSTPANQLHMHFVSQSRSQFFHFSCSCFLPNPSFSPTHTHTHAHTPLRMHRFQIYKYLTTILKLLFRPKSKSI